MDPLKWRIKKTRSGRWGVWPPQRALAHRPRYAAATYPQAVRALAEMQRRAAR